MLSVNINRDVEQYQESVFLGLGGKQAVSVLLGLAAGVGSACLLYFIIGLPMQVSIYISLPVCVPIVLPALGKKYGLTVTERIMQSNKKKRVLVYRAVPVQLQKNIETERQKIKKREWGNGKSKKNKKVRQIPADKKQI